MVYDGVIDYLDLLFGGVDWRNDVVFDLFFFFGLGCNDFLNEIVVLKVMVWLFVFEFVGELGESVDVILDVGNV